MKKLLYVISYKLIYNHTKSYKNIVNFLIKIYNIRCKDISPKERKLWILLIRMKRSG